VSAASTWGLCFYYLFIQGFKVSHYFFYFFVITCNFNLFSLFFPPSIAPVLAAQIKGIMDYEEGKFADAANVFKMAWVGSLGRGAFRIQGQSMRDFAMSIRPTDPSLAHKTLEEATALAQKINDRLLIASVLYTRAVFAFKDNNFPDCHEFVEKCVKVAAQVGDEGFSTWAKVLLALVQINAKQNSDSVETLAKAIKSAKASRSHQAFGLSSRMLVLFSSPKLGQGEPATSFIPNNIGPHGTTDYILNARL
jgi:hypothetical protein